MADANVSQAGEPSPSLADRPVKVRLVLGAMEAVLLLMITASPWVYGAVHPGFEFLLECGIALLLALWGVRMALEGQFTWQKCPVAVCLAGLFLLGIWQSTPIPRSVLAQLSPSTANLYDQLLPSSPEVLPMGLAGPAETVPAGSTISLYSGATRKQTLRLLAIFLVFAVVRNNLVSASVLRRMCAACFINGVFLALFAFVQFSTSPRNMLYWTYPSLGQVFGPFICRNHFPFYVNMCIGLGVGLLLSRNRTGRGRGLNEEGRETSGRSLLAPFTRLLHDPAALWICAALALILGSVALSLSRGGFLSLIGGFVACFLLKGLSSARSIRLGIIGLIGGLAVALASWFGFDLIKARLGPIWKGEAFLDGRFALWQRVLPLAGEFPLWGTGYATFEHVEPLQRTSALVDVDIAWDHAHNDYVELLVEGGLVGLSLGLLAIGLVYWLGCRALRRHEGHSAAGLVLGALFAFTTIVIHSFADFGLHIPAIALLATVLAAQLAGLGSQASESSRIPIDSMAGRSREVRLRFGGLAPILGALTCLGSGLLLCLAGWNAVRVDRLRLAAAKLSGNNQIDAQQRRLAYLDRAAALDPEDADLVFEAGRVRIGIYEKLKITEGGPALTVSEFLLPGLRDYLHARNACPLMPSIQLAIAAHRDRLRKADTRSAYLERAQFLAPGNPLIWYLSGVQELAANEPARAGAYWRHCLELSETYLPEILEKTSSFSPDALIKMVLPDRPEILLAAALRLFPEDEAIAGRRPFLQQALDLLASRPEPLKGPDLHVKARIHRYLGQAELARESFAALVNLQPEETNWRYEYAQLLYSQGRLEETNRQLIIILAQQPQHGPARELMTTLTRDITRQK